jgi:hypothetical protein
MISLELITKKSLLKMINELEYYSSVTNRDSKAYILAYLKDEACQTNTDDIIKYFKDLTNRISNDYTKFCYHYTWKEFLSQYDISDNDFNNMRRILKQ